MKRILILDANQRSALAATRSLGKRGIPVFTAEETAPALAGCSRFSKQHFIYPSPRLYPERFVEVLAEQVKELRLNILLPMTELTTALLLRQQSLFPGIVIPFPDISTVDALSDKCMLMRAAESLNIPIPRSWFADNSTALPYDLEQLPYPVVLKPGKSWLFQSGQWRRASVRFADNALIIREILAHDPAFQSHPFIIQEYIEGYGKGIFALYNRGKQITFFAHRRIREKPPSGGVSVLSESTPVDTELGSYARSLLDKAAWHGIAMVEFKVTPEGKPYLMEINTRFWGSLQLAIDAGVDFPYLLYQLACGDQPQQLNEYKVGRRLRWYLGDLDSLYLTLKNRRYSLGQKMLAVLRFFTPSPFKTRHEVDRWGDFGPFWCELKGYIKHILS